MNKLSQYKVSTRMIAVFAIMFCLSLSITLLSLHQLRSVSSSFEEIMKNPMTKYQAANDWYSNSNAAIMRTTVISKSSDVNLTAAFADIGKVSKAKADKYQKTFEDLIVTEEERALFNNIKDVRKTYLATRDVIQKLKTESKMEEAEKQFNEVYLPASMFYESSLRKLVELEFKLITSTGVEAKAAYENSKLIVLSLTLVTLIIGISLSILVTKSILKDLGGEPSYAIKVAQTIAAGDISQRVKFKEGDNSSVLYNLCIMRKGLQSMVGEVRAGADSIRNAAVEIAQGNQDLSNRTESQASSLEETTVAMQELNDTVNRNAQSTMHAQKLVNSTVKTANEGEKVFTEVVDNISQIKDSSKKISEIIAVIDSIAFQTNILALNAAVEAARAGEQGRGFAVVASEVRNLAQRSASAAKEIKGLIGDSVEKVEKGVGLVNKASLTITEMLTNIESVSEVVNNISSASKEQALSIGEVAKAVEQMDNTTQQNAALVEEAAAASDMLQNQTQHMTQLVDKFII